MNKRQLMMSAFLVETFGGWRRLVIERDGAKLHGPWGTQEDLCLFQLDVDGYDQDLVARDNSDVSLMRVPPGAEKPSYEKVGVVARSVEVSDADPTGAADSNEEQLKPVFLQRERGQKLYSEEVTKMPKAPAFRPSKDAPKRRPKEE